MPHATQPSAPERIPLPEPPAPAVGLDPETAAEVRATMAVAAAGASPPDRFALAFAAAAVAIAVVLTVGVAQRAAFRNSLSMFNGGHAVPSPLYQTRFLETPKPARDVLRLVR